MRNLIRAWINSLACVIFDVMLPLVKWSQKTMKARGARAPPMLEAYWANAERGAMSIGGTLVMGLSMVFLSIGFIMFPIATTACTSLLAYAYSANNTITDATYTGLTAVIGITPLLILVGFVSVAVITGFLGMKVMKGSGTANISPGGLMMLGLSIVFIAIGLIIEPVALDGISSVVHGGGTGISTSFTGLSALILVTPVLIHLGFIASAVITGFFGVKSITRA